jgi:hypothetical protein
LPRAKVARATLVHGLPAYNLRLRLHHRSLSPGIFSSSTYFCTQASLRT